MQALARLPLPKVLVPALMPSRLTMGPLTMTSTESGLVVVATPRRSNSGWLTASTAATSKGMCLGSHPAMTALTAIFPTVATPSSGGSVAMGKSSGRSYPASMALTRSGVGGTSGSPSPSPGEEQGVERLKSVACGFDGFGVRAGEVHGGAGRGGEDGIDIHAVLALPRRIADREACRLRRRHEEHPRREQKRKDDAHDGSFRKVSVGVCRGAFRHRPQCPQRRFPRGRTAPPGRRERSRIRENAHGKRRSGLLANGLRTFRKQGRSPREEGPGVEGYSAIFAETGFRTCGKGTQNWDCLPGPPETIILMDSRWVKRGIRVLAS